MPTKKKRQPKISAKGGNIAADAFEAGVKLAIKHPRAVTTAIGMAGPAAYYGIYRGAKAIRKAASRH